MDIRELRIGNSVLVNGVRAKVIDLHRDILNWKESPHRIFVEGISPETGELMQVGAFVASDSVQPIPITEELLKELGFEEDTSEEVDRRYYSKVYDLWLEPCEDMLVQMLLNAIDGETWQCITGGMAFVKHLHELETFVYLTTKKELI